jgi:hypothetical protein
MHMLLLATLLGVQATGFLPCRPCEIGEQYEVRPCDANHATVCANCTVCAEDEYEEVACDLAHDTHCSACSVCTPGITFAVGKCGPENDKDAECHACTRCAAGAIEVRPCTPTHDTVCSQLGTTQTTSSPHPQTTPPTSKPTLLSLKLSSDLPASAFTPSMLLALSNAFASALRLPPDAVEVLGIQRRRLLADLTVALLIRAPIEPAQIASVDLDAVAQTSGLPITIQSLAVVLEGTAPATTPTPSPTTTDKTVPIVLAAVGGVVGFALLVALVILMKRPHRDGIVRRIFI